MGEDRQVEQIATVQPEKVWYTVKELAAEWGMKESWIRDHVTRKKPRIKARKFGRLTRFHRDDIETFLKQIETIKEYAA